MNRYNLYPISILFIWGLSFAQTGFSKETSTSWVPMGAIIDTQSRCDHLYQVWEKNNRELIYGINSMPLPEQGEHLKTGMSFSFDGPVDLQFVQELFDRKNETINVLIPAIGSGRSVMDVLAVHKNAHVYANDMRESAFTHLNQLLTDFGSDRDRERISNLLGDMENELDSLDEQTIDLVYIANVFHFFSPQKVESVLAKIKRVLKPRAKIFLAWRGTTSAGYTQIPHYSGNNCQGIIRDVVKQEKLKMNNPRYVKKSYSLKTSYNCIYPYYSATTSDMEEHANKLGFKVVSRGESALVCCRLKIAGKMTPLLGEYKYFDVSGESADPAYPHVNHLVLEQTVSSSSKDDL